MHRVTESILREHGSTLLGQLGLRALRDGNDDPIFIDRDGDIFIYILNYLREKEIDLPMSVPKPAFMAEIRHYGVSYTWDSIRQYGYYGPSPALTILSAAGDLALITLAGVLSVTLISHRAIRP